MTRAQAALVGLVVLWAAPACRKPAPVDGAATDAAGTSSVSSPAVTHGAAANPPSAATLPCRVIGITGKVSALIVGTTPGDGGAPLLYPGADVPSSTWLDLGEAAKITAKDPRTTRETTFFGPALIRACVHQEEESWIASGSFESAPGAGETLGAEEWVISPFGVVRYGAAGLTLIVSAKEGVVTKATLRLDRGTAYLATARDAHAAPWKVTPLHPPDSGDPKADDAGADAGSNDGDAASWARIDAPTQVVLTFAQTDATANARAAAALADCQRAATTAKSIAVSLAEPNAPVGALTARHVTARRLAHVTCAVAELRAAALPHGEQGALLESVREATARWKSAAP